MRVDIFPGSRWALALELLPLSDDGWRASRLRALPAGSVLLTLASSGLRPPHFRSGRHCAEAVWRPGVAGAPGRRASDAGWSPVRDVSVVAGAPTAAPVPGRPGSLAAVMASLCPSLGLSPSGRVAAAVLRAVPSDVPSLVLALSVVES